MKFKKRKKRPKTRKKPFDKVSQKGTLRRRKAERAAPPSIAFDPNSKRKPRGRPPKTALNLVTGHAYNFRTRLTQVWRELEGPLLAAQTEEEVVAAFENHAPRDAREFVPELASDILALIRDPKFPKRREVQINFLADSLGGRPELSLRTSRDICERERAKQRRKSPHHIIRKEFYVECTCGYKGPARDNACPTCGAEISLSYQELLVGGLF